MRHLDLFSGIGGFALGFKRAGGFETIGFCDNDKKTHLVLKKNFPGVPIYDDVKTLKGEQVGSVDIITGGFPCQDISLAGKGAGLAGERSGLWFEMHRIIKETRPKWVIAENVSALRSRGLEQVLWSLAEIGYDAEWHCIPASAIGAPHRRDRIWIVAYPNSGVEANGRECTSSSQESNEWGDKQRRGLCDDRKRRIRCSGNNPKNVLADTYSPQCQGRRLSGRIHKENTNFSRTSWWEVEPNVDRVVDGLPGRMDRLKQLGNAIVPQIAELLGLAIKKETH
jgi:DNA (cytosine-5)-methyltransferase 1